jgi:hypothetical protein
MEDRSPSGPSTSGPALRPPASGSGPAAAPHPLPSGKYPLETHFALLRRFMSVSLNGAEPVEPSAVEGQGVPPGCAQANAGFLSDLGLLVEEKPGRFKPTPLAMQLVNTQLADDQRGRRLLGSLVRKTWFGATAQTFLRARQGQPFGESDLITTLTSAVRLPSGRDDGAIRVLIGYLVYTGIVVMPERQGSRTDAAAVSTRGAALANAPSSRRAPPSAAADRADWEVIDTNEFSLRIRPTPAAVKRLRKQLDLLDQKLKELG